MVMCLELCPQKDTKTSRAKADYQLRGLIVFQSLNGVRLNTNQGDILPNAPIQPDFIGKLPGFSVTAERSIPPAATLTDSAPPQDNPGFTLYIESTSFSSPVLVLATRPLSAGVTKPDPKQFRQIACLPNLTGPITDLSGFYYSQFAAPAAGMKVAIQIVPVTANGFRGNPFTQIATVANVG